MEPTQDSAKQNDAPANYENAFMYWHERAMAADQAVERLEREVVKWQEVASLRTAGDAKFLREMELLKQQVAQLTEEVQCLLANEPLSTGEYVHHVACDGDRSKPAGTPGVSCSCQMVSRKQYATLRTAHAALVKLVEALPVAGLPVEHSRPGDVIVLKDGEGWLAHTYNYWAKFATEDEAKAYAALLQYCKTLPREGGAQEVGT